MKEQHIESYDVDSYSSLLDMKSDMSNHIKRGWCVKCMCNTAADIVVVVYEKEVVVEDIENIEEKIKI